MSSVRPRIGVTMGDAAGIGPEIVIKAIENGEFSKTCDITIIGDAPHLESVAFRLGIAAASSLWTASLVDMANLPAEIEMGVDAPVTGKASAEYIEQAVDLWRKGEIDAIATAPISKKAIGLAGYEFPGHTEFLAHLTGTTEFAMSFFAAELRVILLSTHLALRDAIELVRRERIERLIRLGDREMRRLLKRDVRIAVAGLNPHASEGGMFGTEEGDEIIPAIEAAIDAGIDVSGPYPADTVFFRAARGEFDAVISLYHDQATIPVKTLAFDSAVNVTLGLPVIRTSVDHGTAFDIAGKFVANERNMISAISLAAELTAIR